jgi:ECF transporter S component (folate family)
MSLKELLIISLLIAMEFVLSRFLSISTSIVKIGFNFIPIAIIAMWYGPLKAGIAAALSDFLGAMIAPIGPYFPGFTLTAFLTGVIYGIFLYKREKSWSNISLAAITVSLVLTLVLDSFWLHTLYGQAFIALLPTRLLKVGIMIPLQILMIKLVWEKICNNQWVRGNVL